MTPASSASHPFRVLFLTLIIGCSAPPPLATQQDAVTRGRRISGPKSSAAADPACEDCQKESETCKKTCETLDEGVGQCKKDCEAFEDHCWEINDCDGPYADTSPICNYLDRGINDFRKETADRYLVVNPAIAVLDDIEKLEFGLDLPSGHCESSGHPLPCADSDYSTKWTIDAVSMRVNGIEFFFDEKDPADQFLLAPSGGIKDGGIVGYASNELRFNPRWGLTENELAGLVPNIPLAVGSPASMAALFKSPTIPGDRIALLLDSSLGHFLSGELKKGQDEEACEGEYYCDNKRGLNIALRETYSGHKADCDFGGCPDKKDRAPSPWVEIQGSGSTLMMNVDLEVLEGIPDLTDCVHGQSPCGFKNSGTHYVGLGAIGLETAIQPTCVPDGSGRQSIVLAATSVDIQMESTLLQVVEDTIDLVCNVVGLVSDGDGCDPIGDAEMKMLSGLNTSLQRSALVDGLPACPMPIATVAADGTISFPPDSVSPSRRVALLCGAGALVETAQGTRGRRPHGA